MHLSHSPTLSLSLCRLFRCFLSAFSSFYFLLIIFNFFSVSILALLRVFFSHFFFLSCFFLDTLFLALFAAGTCCCLLCACSSAGRRRPFWRAPDRAWHGMRHSASRLGWWSSYIYTCGALIFFCFSFAFLFTHFCLCFCSVALLSCRFPRWPARFYELYFVFRGSLPSFYFLAFFSTEFALSTPCQLFGQTSDLASRC